MLTKSPLIAPAAAVDPDDVDECDLHIELAVRLIAEGQTTEHSTRTTYEGTEWGPDDAVGDAVAGLVGSIAGGGGVGGESSRDPLVILAWAIAEHEPSDAPAGSPIGRLVEAAAAVRQTKGLYVDADRVEPEHPAVVRAREVLREAEDRLDREDIDAEERLKAIAVRTAAREMLGVR